MSILHWSIFNDLFQAPQGSGGRHSTTARYSLCWIKAIGSGAPTVGNSTRRRRAWPVIELEDRGLTARSNLRLRLLPRLLLLHSSRKQCRGRDGRGDRDDRGQPSSSSKEDSASCSSNFDAANTDTSLGLTRSSKLKSCTRPLTSQP